MLAFRFPSADFSFFSFRNPVRGLGCVHVGFSFFSFFSPVSLKGQCSGGGAVASRNEKPAWTEPAPGGLKPCPCRAHCDKRSTNPGLCQISCRCPQGAHPEGCARRVRPQGAHAGCGTQGTHGARPGCAPRVRPRCARRVLHAGYTGCARRVRYGGYTRCARRGAHPVCARRVRTQGAPAVRTQGAQSSFSVSSFSASFSRRALRRSARRETKRDGGTGAVQPCAVSSVGVLGCFRSPCALPRARSVVASSVHFHGFRKFQGFPNFRRFPIRPAHRSFRGGPVLEVRPVAK